MKSVAEKIKGDKVIWMVVFLLSIISLLAVYSSTGTLAYVAQGGNTEYYVLKHFIIGVFGIALMFLSSRIKYTYYSRLSQIALWIAVPLLLFTLLKGLSINEASRWITLPVVNLSFQTSDFAKLALIIYIARILTKNQEHIGDFKESFIPTLVPIVIITGLILPANLSTAFLIFSTSTILMYVGGVKIRYILGFGVATIAVFVVIIAVSSAISDKGRAGTWISRIERHVFKTGDNYQLEQSKIAIASGGILGNLPGNSTQRNFLPSPYSDFVYAIIIEEYGILGGTIVVLLYLILFYRGIRVARNSPGTFGALLAAGLSFSLVFQAMINMSVTVGIVPVTGQPLPLISMGGTSIWFTSIAIGIILSVSRNIEESKNNEQPVTTS
jgi:cell division protein FtsW